MAHMYEQEADAVEESRDKAQLLVMSQYTQYTMLCHVSLLSGN